MAGGTDLDGAYSVWLAEGGGLRVEYSPAAMERIRKAAVAAIHRVPAGLETGGVLFGERGDGGVRVDRAVLLDCEHAFGPDFVLSHDDEERLAALLRDSPDEAIGWSGRPGAGK